MSRKIRGIRDAIPPNTVIGRTGTTGNKPGAPFLIDIRNLATKQYVAQTAGLSAINDGYIVSNISGGTAVPIGNAFSAVLDYVFSNAQGSLLYRDSAVWKALAPGTANYLLKTGGTGANPAWVTSAITQSTGDNSTNIATTAFVTTAIANAIAGVNPAVSVKYATTAAGETSGLTYNNGASGIGATLTGANNTVTTIDGHAFVIGDVGVTRVLVKNDTQSPSGAFNGVYLFTALHTSITGDVFTRVADYNQPSDINNTGAIPVSSGTSNTLTSWLLTSRITTVGTDPLTYVQFTFTPVSAANPTGTGSDVASNGVATTYMRSDATFAIQKASSSQFGLIKVDNSTITASGGVITAVGFAPSGAVFHPGFRSGQYYGAMGITSFTATSVLTTGKLYAIPFFVGSTTTFTKMGIFITGGVASSHVELGVYTNTNGLPDALLLDAGQVSSATSSTFATITGLSLQLTPGWYWLAMSPSANSIGIRGFGSTSQVLLWATGTADMSSDLGANISASWTYSTGNLPNPFGSTTQANAVAPYVVIGL